jgi:hypothetical protein
VRPTLLDVSLSAASGAQRRCRRTRRSMAAADRRHRTGALGRTRARARVPPEGCRRSFSLAPASPADGILRGRHRSPPPVVRPCPAIWSGNRAVHVYTMDPSTHCCSTLRLSSADTARGADPCRRSPWREERGSPFRRDRRIPIPPGPRRRWRGQRRLPRRGVPPGWVPHLRPDPC